MATKIYCPLHHGYWIGEARPGEQVICPPCARNPTQTG